MSAAPHTNRPGHTTCAWCGATFETLERPGPTPRYCKPSHRQRAHEARRLAKLATTPPPPAHTSRQPRPTPPRSDPATTIYECPTCQQRYLGNRRCPDCNTFCRRIGPSGLCPHCDEPVAHNDLTEGAAID